MIFNQTEPDRSRPCLTLTSRSGSWGRITVFLTEFLWDAARDRWVRTERPQIYVRSIIDALQRADWVGRLPKQARKGEPKSKAREKRKAVITHFDPVLLQKISTWVNHPVADAARELELPEETIVAYRKRIETASHI